MHPLLLAGYTAAHSRRGDPGIWKLPWESSRVGEGSAFPQVAQTLPSHSRSREKSDKTLLPSHYRGYKSTLCREQKQGELRGQVVLLTGGSANTGEGDLEFISCTDRESGGLGQLVWLKPSQNSLHH